MYSIQYSIQYSNKYVLNEYWICIKDSIPHSNKYVLNDVLNGNKCSIKYVLK